jgi:hypothetical protein
MLTRAGVHRQEVADQQPARAGRWGLPLSLPIVGDGREPPPPIDPEPGAAGFEVASGQNRGGVRPKRGRGRRPVVEFVAVGSNDQRMLGVGIQGDQDKSHVGKYPGPLPVTHQALGLLADDQ